jgi:hypothetical protein
MLGTGDRNMTSEVKSAASRANGAKSNGPKSAETKEISSRNSLQHGFTAKKTVVLAVESPERFQEMLDHYAETYQPGSPIEEDLVAEMVAAKWRMQRLRMIETALMDDEMKRQLSAAEAPDDPGARIASGFKSLVDESRAISLASRYEARLYRIHEQSHRTLRELQQTRRERTAALLTPEPESPAPIQDATPSRTPEASATTPSPSEPQPQPSRQNKKLRNEPTSRLSIMEHRSRFGRLKTA